MNLDRISSRVRAFCGNFWEKEDAKRLSSHSFQNLKNFFIFFFEKKLCFTLAGRYSLVLLKGIKNGPQQGENKRLNKFFGTSQIIEFIFGRVLVLSQKG